MIHTGRLLTLVVLAAATAGAQTSRSRPRLAPEQLVSRDGDIPHVELILATHPTDTRVLLGGAMVLSRPGQWATPRAYLSRDGGSTWQDISFPEVAQLGGGDPMVAFTPDGTAIFASLGSVVDTAGRPKTGFFVWHSKDKGETWSKGLNLGPGYDHPQVAVDHTSGPRRGTFYTTVLHGGRRSDGGIDYILSLLRSRDGGASFEGPFRIFSAEGKFGVNTTGVGVFPDGSLVTTWVDFDYTGRNRDMASTVFSATSSDGGTTWSAPVRIAPYPRDARVDARPIMTFPQLATDPRPDGGRVHVVWGTPTTAGLRIVRTMSEDRGKTWSTPIPVDSNAPAGTDQFQSSIAVNKYGDVAVTWNDTRNVAVAGERPGNRFHHMVAVSTDRGTTFGAPQAVSTQVSIARGAGNVAIGPSTFRSNPDTVFLSFLSAAQRYASGGDYLGLAASADGAFHPYWADARTGTYQMYTRRVDPRPGPSPAAPTSAPVAVTTRVELTFDPPSWDATTNTLTIPARLTNSSRDSLFGPFTVTMIGLAGGTRMGEQGLGDKALSVLNATNRITGDGATFVFTDALGDDGVLAPGATSGAMPMRFRVPDPQALPALKVTVTGRVR